MIGLVRNATWSGFSVAVRSVTGLLMALLAVRLLGGQRYGQLVTLISLFVLYLSLNSSVFTVLVTRLMVTPETDRDHKNDDERSAAALFSLTSIVILGFLTLLLWVIAPNILSLTAAERHIVVEIRRAITAMGVMTAFQIITALHSSFIEGAGRLDLVMKWQLIGPVFTTATLFLWLIVHIPITISGYMVILGSGAFIDLCSLMLLKRKLLPSRLSFRLSHEKCAQMWSLLKSGITLQAASLMTLFLEPLNKFFLNYFIGPLAVTAYDLAMKVIWGIQNLFAAAMRVFLHMAGEQGDVVGRTFIRVLTLILVPVLAAHILAAIFIAWVVHEWVMIGDTRQFMMFFGIATVSNLGMIYITPLYISLIGRGELRFIFRSQTIVAVTNLVVSFLFIPKFGLLGAAFGLLGATAYNVVAIYFRHEQMVGKSGGLFTVFKGFSNRYTISVLLLMAAILTGAGHTVNYYIQAAILVLTAIIIMGEPIVSTLLERMRHSK